MTDVQRKIQAHLASDTQLKESAQRAFQAYLKSVYLLKNKNVFDVFKIETAPFAASLGLAVPPRVRFLQRQLKLREASKPQVDDSKSEENEGSPLLLSDSEDEDVLTVKRRDHDIAGVEVEDQEPVEHDGKHKVVTKAAMAKKMLKKNIKANQVIHFDDDGVGVDADAKQGGTKQSEEGKAYDAGEGSGIDISKAKEVLKAEDKFDRQLEKHRVRQRKLEEKRKLKESKMKRKKASELAGSEHDDSEESEAEEPNLDWLPDPDQVYGKKDESYETSDDSSEEEQTTQKRKWKPPKKAKTSAVKKPRIDDFEVVNTNVKSAEELALQLLRSWK